MTTTSEFLTAPPERTTSRTVTWVLRSRALAVVWLAMRVWLGIMWIRAGWAKLWGAENAAFLHHGGAAVAGFATHGTSAYTWWHSILTGAVVPNAGAIGVAVAVSEFAIGVLLVAGLFTRLAALASLGLLFTYVMSGTASVCAFYALFALVILLTWQTSSWIGVDGVLARYRQTHHDSRVPWRHSLGFRASSIQERPFGPSPKLAQPDRVTT
jgi:thiosulfate dehydrogenase [quinone] large subunit